MQTCTKGTWEWFTDHTHSQWATLMNEFAKRAVEETTETNVLNLSFKICLLWFKAKVIH